MRLSPNISDVIKLKLFTHEKTKQSYVGVRSPIDEIDSKCHIFAPCRKYSVSFYKTICNHENCFKARKQNARTWSFIIATDHKIQFRKKHHESQHNPMELLCFDKKKFLENIHWHTSNQLSLEKLMYTLTVIVKIQLCSKHLFLLRAMLPHVRQSKRNDSNKFGLWKCKCIFHFRV